MIHGSISGGFTTKDKSPPPANGETMAIFIAVNCRYGLEDGAVNSDVHSLCIIASDS